MRTHRYLGAGLLAAGLTLLVAAPTLRAQPVHEHAPIPAEQLAEAEALYVQAEALMSTCDKAQWKEAAKLFEESARLRECHDPKIYFGLMEAGNIAYYLDDPGKARRLFRESADHAMHVGDVEHAVEAYVRAFFVAAELGDGDAAITYNAWAADLAHSPLLGKAKAKMLQELVASTLNNDKRPGGF